MQRQVDMSDTIGIPAAKRRRTMNEEDEDDEMTDITSRQLTLQGLPVEAVKQILHHLHTNSNRRGNRSESPCTLTYLKRYCGLRELCTLFRDAFDSHVSCLDLSDASDERLDIFITRAMVRYKGLTSLTVPEKVIEEGMVEAWGVYFERFCGRIGRLVFVAGNGGNAAARVFAKGCGNGLETVSTTNMMLVVWVGRECNNVHTLELLMDGMEPEVLGTVKGLRLLKMLYRERLCESKAWRLVQTLKQCEQGLHSVELRLNDSVSERLGFVCEVPRLRKLSLFDGVVHGREDERGMDWIGRCEFLQEVQLEWMKGLNGDDVERLGRLMGNRLGKLRIWNCDEVTDKGLEALASLCPRVEVELRFEREQFDGRTLAMFGERVSWGSFAI